MANGDNNSVNCVPSARRHARTGIIEVCYRQKFERLQDFLG